MLNKRVKSCPIDVHMKSGIRISGRFPVPANTSTSVRPTDAIRLTDSPYLLLCDATIHDRERSYVKDTLLVRCDAISHIEFSETSWIAPLGASVFDDAVAG